MRLLLVSAALACASTSFAVEVVRAPYVPDVGNLAIRCGKLIDGLADTAQSGRLVMIRDGRIESVKAGTARASGVPVLDLSDHTCLPGLIDTHTHLTDRASETRDLSIYYSRTIDELVAGGADSIEHASLADDEAIALAVEHDVAFSMDLYNGDYIATAGREQGWPEEFLRKNEEFLRKNDETVHEQREVLRKAYKAGVPIIYGTDSAVYPHGDNALQFPIMIEFGMTPMDTIRSATSLAARYIDDRVGAIEAGRLGDLIAVRGDPLADIAVLQDVAVVIKGGQLFKYTQPHGTAGD
jgi:imidazolonepropionase-like amidohydrolase